MQAKKKNAVGCKVSVVWSLEMGVTIHQNHKLLWYKVKGFPQFFPTANSSKQLKQRSISCTFSSHLQVTSPSTLRYAGPASCQFCTSYLK